MPTANDTVAQMLRRKAFRLQVDSVDATTFFSPKSSTPDLSVPASLLANVTRPTGPGLLTDLERTFFSHIGDVWLDEQGVSDFSVAIMELFKYHGPKTTLEKQKTFTFHMNGPQQVDIDIAATVMKGVDCMLLVMNASGKNPSRGVDYEPALVAAALSAFRSTNLHRLHAGQTPHYFKDFPCIAMIGTAPVFYRISITQHLVEALDRPAQGIAVTKHIPAVPNPGRYIVEGMAPLENRRVVFQCLEAFGAFVTGESLAILLDPLAYDYYDLPEW